MKARHLSRIAACILIGFCAKAGASGDAQVFRLRCAVVGVGGAVMRGADWRLDGTVGQTSTRRIGDANGSRLDEGFWSAVAAGRIFDADLIFADGFDAPGSAP